MAGSCCWSRAACLVALWAAVVSNAYPIKESAIAKHHQTILLPCRTDCQGTVCDIRWTILSKGGNEDIVDSRKKRIGNTNYIDNENASMTVEYPDWEEARWHRCKCLCQNQHSLDMYTDTSIRLIKDVKTNNIIAAKVGESISIPCQGNSESLEWHFARPGQPYYPVKPVSGTKHSIDDNKSLLIHNLQKKDAGFYLCELKHVKDFYETKVNIIRDRPPATTKSTLASPKTTANADCPSFSTTPRVSSTTPSSKEEPSGVNLTPVYIAMSVVVCTAIACGAACYARKQWKIGRSNRADSATDNADRTYTSLIIPPALYETIHPSETEREEEYAAVVFIGE